MKYWFHRLGFISNLLVQNVISYPDLERGNEFWNRVQFLLQITTHAFLGLNQVLKLKYPCVTMDSSYCCIFIIQSTSGLIIQV